MFTDSRLEEISVTESQPVANRLLAELIIELRRFRAVLIKPEEEPKPPIVVKKRR